jgi:hypothetical protein
MQQCVKKFIAMTSLRQWQVFVKQKIRKPTDDKPIIYGMDFQINLNNSSDKSTNDYDLWKQLKIYI